MADGAAVKLTNTQARILINAREGRAVSRPFGMSEHGGWASSLTSCFRKNLLLPATPEQPEGVLTDLGVTALVAWEARR